MQAHLSAEARDAGTMRSRLKELADTNTQLHQEAQASLERARHHAPVGAGLAAAP